MAHVTQSHMGLLLSLIACLLALDDTFGDTTGLEEVDR
jgi:hypothetical protein